MSQVLIPLQFPLHGSRLIEASAGTGKTWTIAALYLRLVLGHGSEASFGRSLLPTEILVMTFTRAATRELSNRVRERLIDAAKCFRGNEPQPGDVFLRDLIQAYAPGLEREQAAHRLMLAAETMDDAAIFTIDAWCQRMLREHAFDSGSLFDEELVSDDSGLFQDAVRDYWRQEVYALSTPALARLDDVWPDVYALEQSIRWLVPRTELLPHVASESLNALITRIDAEQGRIVAALKDGWQERADRMQAWIAAQLVANPKCFNGTKLKMARVDDWCDALRAWAADIRAITPALSDTAWKRLTRAGLADACGKNITLEIPDDFDVIASLKEALDALEPLKFSLLAHAATRVARRIADLKLRAHQFGFADMLTRLRDALKGANGAALRARITAQFPVALIDEFQDTSPQQYEIFDLLYRIAGNDPEQGLFLIGDPKQSIYGFRGADIHSYLAARRATEGRHYLLDTNYRSTDALVRAVNRLFLNAEGGADSAGFPAGAFKFRAGDENPLPFENVRANGRPETLMHGTGELPALSFHYSDAADLRTDDCRKIFASHCAEQIVALLNDPTAGFRTENGLVPVEPADIAVLVRDRHEAAAIRSALQRRKVASVYLSDNDSVLESEQALDVLRWLRAIASPLESRLARAAFASPTVGLSITTLATLAADDLEWERRVEQLKELQQVWSRQGVLAMLRRFIHEMELPARLLGHAGGERSLTNLLHLAELLQTASHKLDGEQALIRWLAEQIDSDDAGNDENIIRLESDAQLVKVVTIHKSKGLEYPLVFLPYAAAARPTDRKKRSFFAYTDQHGQRKIDFALSDESLESVEAARIEEDLRLLYVALTRARHYLWLGVAALAASRSANTNKLNQSALGYLIGGGAEIAAAELGARLGYLRQGCPAIHVQKIDPSSNAMTRLTRAEIQPALIAPSVYSTPFERDWSIGSFTSLTRALVNSPVATRPLEDKLLEDEDSSPSNRTQNAPWHRFPRGSLPGLFLHGQLQLIAEDGFASVLDDDFPVRMSKRCARAGWGNREADAIHWLQRALTTSLPPLDAALCGLGSIVPEMEFWFPSERLRSRDLDALCRLHLLNGEPRPTLPERQLHGMLKGFADLIFEHGGRYWVLDYKSNALGNDDASYHEPALQAGMAVHRYDVQAAIYMLALHRLLKSRLGASYDPATRLGGAVFFFLRGIGNAQTRGCYHVPPSPELLEELDSLLNEDSMSLFNGAQI